MKHVACGIVVMASLWAALAGPAEAMDSVFPPYDGNEWGTGGAGAPPVSGSGRGQPNCGGGPCGEWRPPMRLQPGQACAHGQYRYCIDQCGAYTKWCG
jgi:hypothetical protein